MDQTRRNLCRLMLAAPLILPTGRAPAGTEPELDAIERRIGGRLGVAAGSAERVLVSYRAGERFPMCSTFKVLAVAAILARVEAKSEGLDRTLSYGPDDVLSYAPVTRKALEAQGGTGPSSARPRSNGATTPRSTCCSRGLTGRRA